MIYYRVCYFNFNYFKNDWEIVKEYPLSEDVAWTRVEYLLKCTRSLIWLEKVGSPSVCEDCEHFDWDIEKCESYCGLQRTSVPWDWSCPDFNFLK